MPDCWTKEELLIAFNKAYMHIKGYVDNDVPLNIFTANIFQLESVKLQASELIDCFKIEISEDKKNVERINNELLKIKEVNNNFNNCKNKLIKVMQWNVDLLNHHSYNINKVIDYLFHVIDTGVVKDNKEDFIQIRSSFDKLRNRKNKKNNNYQTNLNTIISNINILRFPNYFKNELPNIEINKVLDEIY
jgi:hypothetical protein